jgi:NADH-quinone oxidoreductase subunit M
MGPMTDPHYNKLGDAIWAEKLAAGILITGIVVIGVAPFWIYHLINPGTEFIVRQLESFLLFK